MRENRTCSSEGGEPGDRASLPYRRDPEFRSRMGQHRWGATKLKLQEEVARRKSLLPGQRGEGPPCCTASNMNPSPTMPRTG